MNAPSTIAWSLLVALALAPVAGCVRARPYEREDLSLRAMSPGSERCEDNFRQHWGDSREGAAGGYAAAGGGCGCN